MPMRVLTLLLLVGTPVFNAAVAQGSTASETGNTGFAVQRSGPSQQKWIQEGFLDGQGTTTTQHSYQFTTDPLAPGLHRFRLKQVDVDGSVHYSTLKRLRIQPPSGLVLHGPNPVRTGERVYVTVGERTDRSVEVALFNELGQRLRMLSSLGPGDRVPLPTAGLAPGTYFLRAQGPGMDTVRKITVVK